MQQNNFIYDTYRLYARRSIQISQDGSMDNAGTHHSIGIYIGDKGFVKFLYTLAADRMDTLDALSAYPTPEGGKQIPLITADESGAYSISTTTTPPLPPKQYIAPTFSNDILTSRLRNIMPHQRLLPKMRHKAQESKTHVQPGHSLHDDDAGDDDGHYVNGQKTRN